MIPNRIQQRRTPGWRKPAGAASVVRGTRWGNPYKVGVHAQDNAEAVRLFIDYLDRHPELVDDARVMLAGKPLMCWCPPDQPCHADIWLQVVNTLPMQPVQSVQSVHSVGLPEPTEPGEPTEPSTPRGDESG